MQEENLTTEKIISEIIVKHIQQSNEARDSLEIGTAKYGSIKVYCNFENVEETKSKIDKAILCRNYAQSLTINEVK